MICLGFTTSTSFGSLALSKNSKNISQVSWTKEETQSDILTSRISQLLKKNSLTPQDLELVAVDRGPGSFTGTRIAVNVAKTLSFGLGINIYSTDSLQLLASGVDVQKKEGVVFCLIDAHRQLFYFSAFNLNKDGTQERISKNQALTLDQIVMLSPKSGLLILLGESAPLDNLKMKIEEKKPKLSIHIPRKAAFHAPQAKTLVKLALESLQSDLQNWSSVEPSYIRDPDAVEKLLSSKN